MAILALYSLSSSRERTGDEVSDELHRLEELMADLGHPHALVRAEADDFQRRIWAVRKAAMNVVMSMKGDRKPVSFIEDCTVPLEHLSEYGRASRTCSAVMVPRAHGMPTPRSDASTFAPS